MLFHDGQMEGVTRRQPPVTQDNLLGTLCGRPIDVQNLIHDAQQGVKGRLDSVPAVDGDITDAESPAGPRRR